MSRRLLTSLFAAAAIVSNAENLTNGLKAALEKVAIK